MELLINYPKVQKMNNHITELTTFNEKIISTIGRDFHKSVANINGLVSLLNDVTAADPDVETIHRYLSIEARKLDFMVKDICG